MTNTFALKLAGLLKHSSKFFSTVSTANKMSEPILRVAQGQLRGAQHKLFDGTPYYSFKGIPYAQVPARFLAPQPPASWNGVLDATKHGPVCTQYNMMIQQYVPGSEDCLFLNVYTKSLDKQSKLPVMVYIHGGAFMSGSGDDDSYGPEFLIQHDVILVTINYRLEALGFLCLDTPEVPGNAGMRDQVAALKWVRNNIEQFGGNPNDVTLFGESAGAAAVVFHMQSPMSKGLFHKAILQSGVSIVDWAQCKGGKERALRAANYLGENVTDTTKALKFLQSVPAEKLTQITLKTMTSDEKHRGLPIHFAPVVEKKFDNVEPFLTEEPIDSLVSGHIAKVPLMLGYNSDEGLLMVGGAVKKVSFINKNPQYLVPREIAERVSEEKTKEIGERIKSFYTNGKDFSASNAKEISDLLSDIYFVYAPHRFVSLYAPLAKAYLYRFSLDTELNVAKNASKFSNITKGATHADDLFYFFNNPVNEDVYREKPEIREIVNRLTKLWTDFAKTGNPTPDNKLGVQWTPYSASNHAYLDINDRYTMGQNAEKPRVDFWNKIYCEVGLPCTPKSNL